MRAAPGKVTCCLFVEESVVDGQAGAAHVYGIEMSAIAEQAEQIVADNGFASKVTIIRGKVEEVDLPVKKVRSSPVSCSSCHQSHHELPMLVESEWLLPS